MPRRDGDRLCRSNHAYASTKAKRGRRTEQKQNAKAICTRMWSPLGEAWPTTLSVGRLFLLGLLLRSAAGLCFGVPSPVSEGVCVVMCVVERALQHNQGL